MHRWSKQLKEEHTRAGAKKCPLGPVPHAALGVKYALGCQACNVEAASLAWETCAGESAAGGGGGGGGGGGSSSGGGGGGGP